MAYTSDIFLRFYPKSDTDRSTIDTSYFLEVCIEMYPEVSLASSDGMSGDGIDKRNLSHRCYDRLYPMYMSGWCDHWDEGDRSFLHLSDELLSIRSIRWEIGDDASYHSCLATEIDKCLYTIHIDAMIVAHDEYVCVSVCFSLADELKNSL